MLCARNSDERIAVGECAKFDSKLEQALAENGMAGELEERPEKKGEEGMVWARFNVENREVWVNLQSVRRIEVETIPGSGSKEIRTKIVFAHDDYIFVKESREEIMKKTFSPWDEKVP